MYTKKYFARVGITYPPTSPPLLSTASAHSILPPTVLLACLLSRVATILFIRTVEDGWGIICIGGYCRAGPLCKVNKPLPWYTLNRLGADNFILVFLRYGTQLVEFCREQHNIRADIAEMALIIEGVWLKTEVQLRLLKGLWDTGTLEPALRAHYGDAIQRLQVKISGAVAGLENIHERTLSASSFPRNAKIVYLKRHLQQVVKDLEDWQRRFDPSWYLIARIAGPAVDQQLKLGPSRREPSATRLLQMRNTVREISSLKNATSDSVFRRPELIERGRQQIPGTRTYVSRYSHSGRQILLDSTDHVANTAHMTSKAHVRDLARLLHHVHPTTFGLLKCEGVIEVPTDQGIQFDFIFGIPEGLHSPTTMRSLLMEKPQCSLSKRVQLAKQLARSVMFVHTTGFVHKGIRPETVVVFNQGSQDLGPSFLIGFERIRRAGAQTDLLGDLEWERNLYRHPVRQGLWPEEAFSMQHDIYSLGVCLLEIALWRSFVHIDDEGPTPWSELRIEKAISDRDARRGGFAIKKELVTMAKDRLPSLVGDRYSDLVLACLCCLDKDNVFDVEGPGVKDNDGMIIGVRYIEIVSSCCPIKLTRWVSLLFVQVLQRIEELLI